MDVPIRRLARSAIDLGVLAGAFTLAYAVRYEFRPPTTSIERWSVAIWFVVALQFALLRALAVHRQSWRYTNLADVVDICRAMLAATLVLLAARIVAPALVPTFDAAGYAAIPFGIIAIDLVLAVGGLVTVRAVRRLYAEARGVRRRGTATDPARILLVGAGRAGVAVARDLLGRPDLGMLPVGFLDDDPTLQGHTVHGLPVLGTTDVLPLVAARSHADEALITMAAAPGEVIRRIVRLCDEAELPARIIPAISEIVGGRVNISRIRPVAIEDLLGREPVELDTSTIRTYIEHDVVLVTGAGGSIGSELCRQLAQFNPKKLVLVERAENALWQIHRELDEEFPSADIVPVVADVCDSERIDQLLLHHRPRTVFHAAAHKHVPMMEWNPAEAVRNNVYGTKVMVDRSLQRGVERFVMISTDKAVNPTSVMGATKRLAERYVQHVATTSGQAFVSVRFGNVLGSNGSVVPVFKEQIERGGPVTVTHEGMVRYFMTIPEAAQLVVQAGALGTGGEIFVLDMGDPVSIVELARDLIRLSGFEPEVDIEITFTGMRPGEKMYEEMHLSEENADRTLHPKIWVGRHDDTGIPEEGLLEVLAACDTPDADRVREALTTAVPEFAPSGLDPHEQDTAAFLAQAVRPEPSS